MDFSLEKYAKSYNFCVYFGNKKISCNKVSGITSAIETGSVEEGGRNNLEYKTAEKEHSKNTLVIERALPRTTLLMQYVGKNIVIKVGQEIENQEVSVYLLDEYNIAYWAYYFNGCSISNVGIDSLDAGVSGLVTQRIEITFQSMEEEAIL